MLEDFEEYTYGAGVKNTSPPLKTNVLSINRDTVNVTLPEPIGIDVLELYQCVLVELGTVETAKCDFTVVVAVSNATELERGDRRVD